MFILGSPVLSFVAFILSVFGFVVDLIGFSAPWWVRIEMSGSMVVYEGLWRTCQEIGDSTICDTIDNPKDWFMATQAMECLGFICLFVAVVVLLVRLFVLKTDVSILKWVGVAVLVAGAVFILIGVVIYAAKVQDIYTENFHFAFAFVIIAAIISVIASILLCFDKTYDYSNKVENKGQEKS